MLNKGPVITGLIVGACYRCTGSISRPENWEEQAVFLHKETHLLYKIIEGWTNIPVLAFEKDITVLTWTLEHNTEIVAVEEIPFRHVIPGPDLSPEYRKMLSDEAKAQPRTTDGRFMKNGPS